MGRPRKSVIRAREQHQGKSRFTKVKQCEDIRYPTYLPHSDSLDTRSATESGNDTDCSSESEENEEVNDARGSLQKLYEVFLPCHLRPHVDEAEKFEERKMGERPVIYTGDSERTMQRRKRQQRDRLASVTDCDQKKFGNFFIQLPSRKRKYVENDHIDLELMAGSADINLSLDDCEPDMELNLWMTELVAALDGNREHWFELCEIEIDLTSSESDVNTEITGYIGSQLEDAEFESIQIIHDLIAEPPTDSNDNETIFDILQDLMKVAKCCKTPQAVKSLMLLTGLLHYVKLHERFIMHPKCKNPVASASLAAAHRLNRGPYFACQLRELEPFILRHKKLPPRNRFIGYEQRTLMNNESVIRNLRSYLGVLKIQEITPASFMQHINSVILPSLGYIGTKSHISESTATRWLKKLGYQNMEIKKGLYIDGHEREDVVKTRLTFINRLGELCKHMPKISDETLDIIYPNLPGGQPTMIALYHDEMSVATNEQRRRAWLAEGQQSLCKKGNGHSIHVSDFILETTGRLSLSAEQIANMRTLPLEKQLKVTDARVIIHPGKNGDPWWDSIQLMKQIETSIPIFEFLHPGAVAVWIFDCSSAHEAYATDALNVKNMNINPGGKQRCLRPTKIPLNNPAPEPGEFDTRGQVQLMVYPPDYSVVELCGKAKGIKAILQERRSVWQKLLLAAGGIERNVAGLCKVCRASQVEKDRLLRVAEQQQSECEITLDDGTVNIIESASDTCCMTRALSQQQDFLDEKPQIQTLIEQNGHICLFLPKFHCELNPIELYWGWTKHKYRTVSNQKFSTAKVVIPEILDSVNVSLIRKFFRKTWRYIDAYQKGLNVQQAAFAVKMYKSHRRVGTVEEVSDKLKQSKKALDGILKLTKT